MILGSAIRKDFPIFARHADVSFVYLDSAATSLKPTDMLDAMREYYEAYSVNVARACIRYPKKQRQSLRNHGA